MKPLHHSGSRMPYTTTPASYRNPVRAYGALEGSACLASALGPDAWTDVEKTLHPQNHAALQICWFRCPAQEECLRRALLMKPAHRANTIAGGVVFDSRGVPRKVYAK